MKDEKTRIHKVSFLLFFGVFTTYRNSVPLIKEMTSELKVGTYGNFYLTEDFASGFRVSEEGEITHLFSGEKGRGDMLVQAAIDRGGTHLDCFDGYLVELYKRNDFIVCSREPNWTPGGPDVVFMNLN